MSGTMPFSDALSERLAILPLNKEIITNASKHFISKINTSFLNEKTFLTQNRDRIYVISGGFTECITPVIEYLGLRSDHIFANTFLYDSTDKIVGVDNNNVLSKTKGKVKQLQSLNLPRPIHALGDGYTDFELFSEGAADEFFCFTETIARESVTSKAKFCVSSFTDYLRKE